MACQIIRGQALQLVRRGLNGLCALLDVAREFERQPRSLLVQRLQVGARSLVLVHASQAVAKQGALDIVRGRRACAFKVHCGQSLVDLTIQAESTPCHRHALGFLLRLVTHRFVGGYGVEHAGLRSGQIELLDGCIIEPQRVFRGTRPFNRQKSSQRRLVGSEPGANPCGKRLGGLSSTRLPRVKVFRDGGSNGFNRHDVHNPPEF